MVSAGATVSPTGPIPLVRGAGAVHAVLTAGHLGFNFNVRAAREAARALLPLEAEQAVFEDWTRARGMGPENRELGAFAGWVHWTYAKSFAERLAFEMRGYDWMGGKVWREADGCMWFPMVKGVDLGGWPGKQAREWPGDRRAPMGRSLARLGRRVLEALEGQPDGCERCDGLGGLIEGECSWVPSRPIPPTQRPVVGAAVCTPEPFECPDCHGTGDNLRGHLPEVECTAQEQDRHERCRPRMAAREVRVRGLKKSQTS